MAPAPPIKPIDFTLSGNWEAHSIIIKHPWEWPTNDASFFPTESITSAIHLPCSSIDLIAGPSE